MANEQKPTKDTDFAPDLSVEPGHPNSFRLYITLGLAGLIICQLIVLWLLLPSRNVPQEQTESNSPPSVARTSEPMIEVPLQKDLFRVKQLRGDEMENFTLRVHVLVRKKESSKFDKQYTQYTRRVIDRVEDILHASSRAERQELGLNTLKEKIKLGINDALGSPLVHQVLITEYSFSAE